MADGAAGDLVVTDLEEAGVGVAVAAPRRLGGRLVGGGDLLLPGFAEPAAGRARRDRVAVPAGVPAAQGWFWRGRGVARARVYLLNVSLPR
jgi:hypothetical protein